MMTSAVETSIQDTSPLLTVSTMVGVEAAAEAGAAAVAGAEALAAGALATTAAADAAAGAEAASSAANDAAENPRTASPRAREARSFLMVARLSGVGSVWRWERAGFARGRRAQRASLPVSPVRMRTTCSSGETKIFPSPIFPVRAERSMASMTWSTSASSTAASIFTLGRKSTTYSAPRYSSVWPFWRPKPFTSVTVMPLMPTSWRASFTSSSLNGLMIASIFFMGPCLGLILPVLEQAACQAAAAPEQSKPQDADARHKPGHLSGHRVRKRRVAQKVGNQPS